MKSQEIKLDLNLINFRAVNNFKKSLYSHITYLYKFIIISLYKFIYNVIWAVPIVSYINGIQ